MNVFMGILIILTGVIFTGLGFKMITDEWILKNPSFTILTPTSDGRGRTDNKYLIKGIVEFHDSELTTWMDFSGETIKLVVKKPHHDNEKTP